MLPTGLDLLGQPGHGGRFKQSAQGQLHQHFPYPRDQLGGQQGMAAQLEEVVLDAHPVQLQHLGPDSCQDLFYRRPRSFGCPLPLPSSGRGNAFRSTFPLRFNGK